MYKYKVFILSLVAFFCVLCNLKANQSNNCIYWEDLSQNQQEEILKSNKVYCDALLFYQGKIKVGDDKRTMDLLKILVSTSSTDILAPFYFYLFNQVCIKADGALSEALGSYCQKRILNSPVYVINYFVKNEVVLKKICSVLRI